MFAGCWQIMPVYSHLIRVEGIGYWQLIRAEKMAVCRSCGLYLQAATGTVIPESLVVRFTGYNKIFDANHYQIESKAKMMRMDSFKGALDNLARNAIVKAIELGKKI
jgi:hypothetical protein